MNNIFFGDYGLLTMTPKYLFGVLFPIMIFLEILSRILPRIPFLKNTSPFINQFFYGLIGLGCTTAALSSLDRLTDRGSRSRMAWILILLIPCSAKLTIIMAFASMVTLQVFLVFIFLFFIISAALYFCISRLYPLSDSLIKPESFGSSFHPLTIVKNAFQSVIEAAPAFCVGSVIISLLTSAGVFDSFTELCGPLAECWFHLPPEAANFLLLGMLKRDFGAASLLAWGNSGLFDAAQLTVLVLMMTFSVPCFNSAVILIKQQRLPGAAVIWLGSLLVSLFIGKVVSTVFFVCLF